MTFKINIDTTFDITGTFHLVQTGTRTSIPWNLDLTHIVWDSTIGMSYTNGSMGSFPLSNPGLSYLSNLYMNYFDTCVFHETDIYMTVMGSWNEKHLGIQDDFGNAIAASCLAYGSLEVPGPQVPNGFKLTYKLNEQGQTAVDDTFTRSNNSATVSTSIN
jgi:hypothetical protein